MSTITPIGGAVHQDQLANGLRVWVERLTTAPIAAVAVSYNVGSRHEAAGATGLAHLYEHLMFRGSRNVPRGAFDDHMGGIGAQYNAMTYTPWTTYFAVVPKNAVDLVLWLEADRLATLDQVIDQQALEGERAVVKNERRQHVDVPYGNLEEVLMAELFPPGHPYHHTTIGSMQDLDAATLDDVRAFFHAHYSPRNAHLAIVGDVDPGEVFSSVERYFGGIPAGPERVAPKDQVLGPLAAPRTVVLDDDVPLPQLTMAWRVPPDLDDTADALEVALGVLGGGRASRIESVLVRQRETVLGGDAYLIRNVGADSVAQLTVEVPPTVGLDAAEREVHKLLRDFIEQGPTEPDLTRVAAGHERSYVESRTDPGTRAIAVSQEGAMHHRPELVDERVARLRAVTPDRARAGLSLLDPDRALTIRYPAQTKESDQ